MRIYTFKIEIFNNVYIRICLALEVSNYISDFLSHRNLALARVPLELIKEKFIIHGLANTPTTNAKADTFLKEYYSNCHYFASSIMIWMIPVSYVSLKVYIH